MTKDELYHNINLETGLNEKANAFEENIRGQDYDAALMSQRIATEQNPSGLVKLNNQNEQNY